MLLLNVIILVQSEYCMNQYVVVLYEHIQSIVKLYEVIVYEDTLYEVLCT